MNKKYLKIIPFICAFVSMSTCSEEAEIIEHASLFEAITQQNTGAVQNYIQNHPEAVPAQTDEQRTPLHMAVKSGSLEITRILLNAGAHVNAQDSTQQTPLHIAVYYNLPYIIELLISSGADLEALNYLSMSPLFDAKSVHTAEILISKGADVNTRCEDNSTPLHFAAQYGYLLVVECLVRNGADVNAQNSDGDTPLHLAVYEKRQQTLSFLLTQGADPSIQNRSGSTSLYDAARTGQLSLVQELVNRGVPFHGSQLADLPLNIAAQGGYLDIVAFFVAQDPESVYMTDAQGKTPLEYAVAFGQLPVVEFLLKHGAKTEKIDGTSILEAFTVLANGNHISQVYDKKRKKVYLFLLLYGVPLRQRDSAVFQQHPRLKSTLEGYNRHLMLRLNVVTSIRDLQELILSFVSEIKVPRPLNKRNREHTEKPKQADAKKKKQKKE